jgi:ParB-like chromosome segregation protein Spo0J
MTRLASIDDIVILEDRQRKEFDPDKMEEMRQSMLAVGLLHAPVMREYGGELVLVAGETRIKVIQDLWALGGTLRYNNMDVPEGKIPYVTLGELSPLEAEEAELDENIRRKDLTWQEHSAAMKRLHELRVKQNKIAIAASIAEAVANPGQAPAIDTKQHTIADTAREVYGRGDGSYGDLARKEILVANHLDDPDVLKAKSADDAYKILKRKEEKVKNEQLAAAVGATFNASYHRAFNINCLSWMADTANHGQFDVILTDPPYGMGADSFGDGAGRLSGIEHHYDDSYESWLDLMAKWCPLSYAVAKSQAHAYVFCDIDRFAELRTFMRKAGWYVFRTPLINFKANSGRVPLRTKDRVASTRFSCMRSRGIKLSLTSTRMLSKLQPMRICRTERKSQSSFIKIFSSGRYVRVIRYWTVSRGRVRYFLQRTPLSAKRLDWR